MQSQYNLLYREDEHEMIPVCRQFGMVLTPYSSLAAGRLTRPCGTRARVAAGRT